MRTRSVVVAVALAGGAAALVLLSKRGEPPAPAPPADPRTADVRIAELLEPCVQGGFYDKAVSDVLPILIEKLQRGGGEPLKRAKEELGAAGEEGGRALARLFDQYFSDPMTDAYLENALDAASLNPGDEAHGLLLRALSHPRESVRQRAMTGFVSGRARPEDFDVFLERLAGVDTRPLRSLYARALFVADRERAELETLRWIRERRNEDLWHDFVRELARARSPEAAALARGIYAALDPFLGVWVAVPAAVAGDDQAALAFLREERERPDPRRRLAAVEALSEGGLVDEVLAALEDPDPQVRGLAISGAVEAGTLDRQGLDRITAMLADSSPTVRALALQKLCELGDEPALEQALQELGQGPEFLEQALRALVEPLKRDPALARRAYERIVERYRSEEHRPIAQRTATLKAMGIVPLREAAQFLREVALAAEGETIEGLRAHEWVLIQVANTGEAGRAYLLEELASETDPLRRIDLVTTIAATRDPAARDALLVFVEEETEDPYEILYAASRIVKLGPARLVAPRLKRVATRIADGKLRNAFHCLLWRWY